jgi:hypothetical protein
LCRDDYRGVVFVDKDQDSLAELKRRLRHFETNELEFVFLSLDLNLQTSRLFDLGLKFKTISAQFCLHYFSDKLIDFLKLLDNRGCFFGTLFDKQKMSEAFSKEGASNLIDFGFARVKDLGDGNVDVWIQSINQTHREKVVDLKSLLDKSPYLLQTKNFDFYKPGDHSVHPFSKLYQTFTIKHK